MFIRINIKTSGKPGNSVSNVWGNAGAGNILGPSQPPNKKFIPYRKRAESDKKLIKDNLRTLGAISTIGAATSAVKHFIGSISISNKKGLEFAIWGP